MTSQKDSSQDCARAWELMPWVLQSTAPPDQAEWLTAHLASCEACSTEFAQQSRLRSALNLPSDIPLDADVGFKQLLAHLDDPTPEVLPSRRRSGNRLVMALAAAVVLQAIGLGALGVRLWVDQTPAYRTLSQPAPLQPAGAIRVVPATGLSLSAWDGLLRSFDLRVVDGPNALGAYIVVPRGSPAESARLLAELRAAHNIRLAEPVELAP